MEKNNTIVQTRTWTDKEMQEKLTKLGYDLTDHNGEFQLIYLVEAASHIEKFKWNDEKKVWYE